MFESSVADRIPQWVLDGWEMPFDVDDSDDPARACACARHLYGRGELDVEWFLAEGHIPDVLDVLPAADIVRWLGSAPPSPRVIELTSALTRVSEVDRRDAGWPAWIAPDLLTVWTRIVSWTTAGLDLAIIAVAGSSRRSLDDFGREEVALAMRLAPATAGGRLHQARERTGRLARIADALAAGELLATQADDLIRELHDVDDGVVVDLVLDRVLPGAVEWTRAELVAATRLAILGADPEAAAERHQRARNARGTCLFPRPDGMMDMGFRVTAGEAVTVRAALDDYVRRHADSGRSVEHLRADALVAWAMEQLATRGPRPTAHGRPITDAGISITAGAFLGITDEPAILEGYGPIHAQLARELINADSRVRRLLTDPGSGALIAIDPTVYRAGQFVTDTVLTRDATCRLRGCSRAAEACDLDHTVKHIEGGQTCPCNLAPLCRRHHRMKDAGGWQLVRRDGRLTWITPTGREYGVAPHASDPTEIPSPWAICPTGCLLHEFRPAWPPEPDTPPPIPEQPCPF